MINFLKNLFKKNPAIHSDKKTTLLDFQVKWKQLEDKGCSDYQTLNENERVWFNIQSFMSALDDGGLISYYYNTGADHMIETTADLKKLGLDAIVEQLEKINQLFPDIEILKDFDKRNDVINSWDHENDDDLNATLNEAEKNIAGLSDLMEEKLVEYILENKL